MFSSTSLSTIPKLDAPIALTIGSFDGVHLGHRSLFQKMREKVGPQGSVVVLTFSNHPTQFFSPDVSIPHICTVAHKLRLLEEAGVSHTIILEFTQDLATLTAEEFLSRLKTTLPFSHLILGCDARFGKDREGDEERISQLQETLDFQAEFLPKQHINENTISSGLIRRLIQEGDLTGVSSLLGRPYSLYLELDSNHYAHLDSLCLPPEGVYPVTLHSHGQTLKENITLSSPLYLLSLPAGPVEIVF